jgi:hypothetical protein
MILFLVKVFEQAEHARDFVNGTMFVNRLFHFKKLEGDEGRGDEYEGNIMPQREGLILTLQATNQDTGEVDEITITEDDLAAPVIMAPEWFDHINVFCMYAGHSGTFEWVSEANLLDFKKQLELPEDCINLGDHAVVITNVKEFFRRVKASVNREGYGMIGRLVKYYDPNIGTPPAGSEIDSIFTKRNQYAYQKEFRIAIDTRTVGINPITLNIGPIDDIALRLKTRDINRGLTVNLPPLA